MDEIVRELSDTSARARSNTHRIDKLEANQEELKSLATSTAVMAQRLGTVEQNVGEIKESVESLKSKPGKMFEDIVSKIVWLALGGLIAYAVKAAGF